MMDLKRPFLDDGCGRAEFGDDHNSPRIFRT